MGNVVGINGQKPSVLGEPRDELVKALEKLLEKAKSGDLQSFIGTGFTADGMRASLWCDTHENVYEMLGSIVWLEHEYVDQTTRNVEQG